MAVPDWVPKDLKKDFKKAEKQSWTFKKTTNGGQAFAPDGEHLVTFHLTPGRYATRSVLSKMKQYGYDPNA
jgi:hypothetical protein